MRDFAYNWITEQPILVRVRFSKDTHITPNRAYNDVFSFRAVWAMECNMTTYSARGESMHILDKLHWRVMETSFLLHND